MIAGALMVQGTTSDAGKSTLVAGLGRVLYRRGVRVAPFKPQNMALNSAVTVDGGEIGRAQAVQAQACGVAPRSDMNPVLLKPSSDTGAQVIIHGKAFAEMDARRYHDYKRIAMAAVLESWARLRAEFECVLVEGAGSPAEINLRDRDIANMGFAEAVDCPVILIADIDRGGVFAHLVGTLALLAPSEQARIQGFVINRFRGDLGLLQPGLDWLERHTGKPVLGVLPYLHGLHLEAEDALARESPPKAAAELRVIVPALPRISNHTDFDALRLHPQVEFSFVGPGADIPAADLIVLPGSKNVRADLEWLRANGWEDALLRHLRYGGRLFGICGGLQMLGRAIHDPLGLEDRPGSSTGLALLDLETSLGPDKQLRRVEGVIAHGVTVGVTGGMKGGVQGGARIAGYEIHMGITQGPAVTRPFARLQDGDDGAVSADGRIAGTYVHGVFDLAEACDALLAWAGLARPDSPDYLALRDHHIDRLADAIERHVDMERVLGIINPAPALSA